MGKLRNLPPLTRIIIATGLFTGVLAVVLFLFLPADQPPPSPIVESRHAPGQNDDFVFYKNIGISPRKLGEKLEDKQGKSQYTVELDKVQNRAEAEAVIHKLHDLGVDAFFTPLHREGRVFFRIRSGIFASQEIALREAKKIRENHNLKTKVTRL